MNLDIRSYQALETIYDTAVNPGSWRKALDATASVVEAKAIALVVRGRNAGAKDLTLMSSVYLDFSRTPAGWYYGAWLSRLQNRIGIFFRRSRRINQHQTSKREFQPKFSTAAKTMRI